MSITPARIHVLDAVKLAANGLAMSWPKWIAFTFVYGVTFGTVLASTRTKLRAYCSFTSGGHVHCNHLVGIIILALLLVGGIAGFITVCAVWTQRRFTTSARWGRTFLAAQPLSICLVAGAWAITGIQHAWLSIDHDSFTAATLLDEHLLLAGAAAVGLLAFACVIPLPYTPLSVADGRSFREGVRVFRANRLPTVAMVVVTLSLVVAAVILARTMLYLLPLFALLVPIIALMWVEGYWQAVDPVDEADSFATTARDEIDDLNS